MKNFEMGGYLPLELPQGEMRFASLPEEMLLALNTGRAAIKYGIRSLGVSKILAPAYYCPDIIAMLESLGLETEYYRIGENLLPVDLEDRPDTAVILVNYFGILGDRIRNLSERFSHVVIDQAHGYFEEPVIRDGVMNVYSCRKFLGVCDGAYLIGRGIRKPELPQDRSSDRAIHLLRSIEEGTNGAYLENKHNEQVIGLEDRLMSPLTARILRGVDEKAAEARRRENYRILHRALAGVQQLEVPEEAAAYAYPLLLDRDLHRELVQRKIYVPLLWSQLLEPRWNGSLEQRLSTCLVPLPVDHRYGPEQMEYLAQTVLDCCRKKAE